MVSVAQKSRELIVRGILNTEQAIAAVKTCNSSKISLQEAFRQFNWDPQALNEVSHLGINSDQPGAASFAAPAPNTDFPAATASPDTAVVQPAPVAVPSASAPSQSPEVSSAEPVQVEPAQSVQPASAAPQLTPEPILAEAPAVEATSELAPVPHRSSTVPATDMSAQTAPEAPEVSAASDAAPVRATSKPISPTG